MTQAVAYSNFRANLKTYMRRVNEDADTLLVTNADPEDNVVVMSADDYDSLMETLRVYLDNNLSVTRTAAALYLHRSTLLDRLAHITQMLGRDLKDPDFCLTLGILLRAELQQKRLARPKT